MPFCPNCGKEQSAESKFCASCGKSLGTPSEPVASPSPTVASNNEEKIIWEGKPSGLGERMKEAAHVNSTFYTITNQRIIIKTGLLGKKNEEIELVRVKDIKLTQSLKDRITGVGDIQIISNDSTAPMIVISDIREPNVVKETLRNAIRADKQAHGVKYTERF